MNRKLKRQQEKLARKKGGQPTQDIGTLLNLAGQSFNSGQFASAAQALEKVLKINPDHFDAVNALAIAYANLGRPEKALPYFEKTTLLKPGDANTHYNYGRACEEQGNHDGAIESYRRSVEIDPQNAAGWLNLGNLVLSDGNDAAAEDCYLRALDIDANIAVAHNNLGNLYNRQRRYPEAIERYEQTLALIPVFPETQANLAGAYAEIGEFEKSEEIYRKALEQSPDDAALHYNLGNTLQKLSRLDDALKSFSQAIILQPSYEKAWNNLKYALKARWFDKGEGDWSLKALSEQLGPEIAASPEFAILTSYLSGFRPQTAGDSFKVAMSSLPEQDLTGGGAGSSILPDKLIGLTHFGRSGTGLIHSLIDSHPEISTLPGVYLRGFFNVGVWEKMAGEGWKNLADNFAELYPVLFDAHAPEPVPSRLGEEMPYLGREEGLTAVGENRDESLSLDKEIFLKECKLLLKGLDRVDPRNFLMAIHGAFDKTLGIETPKSTVFYHIHNPDEFAAANFGRHAPDAQMLLMVRDPVENCESWIRPRFEMGDYSKIVHRILSMLFEFDRPVYSRQAAVGVRLEDLKSRPEETMKALCSWMGVEESPTLFEMTAQGKKWWGDPSSPNYVEGQQMSSFGDAETKRSLGDIFSETDRLILSTLFYPFNVRFGYAEADPAGFEKNLEVVGPLLEELMDFEKALVERLGVDADHFKQDADYLLLRAGMTDRWQTLRELKDYPNMIQPLAVISS